MTTSTITVYTRPSCGPCIATKRSLEKIGRPFEEEVAADFLEALRELGYQQAPVTIVTDAGGAIVDHWGGFRPEKIEEWAAA